jgi:hypothetical protein
MQYIPNIIVEASNADFNNHAYFYVYAGVTTSVTINGVAVTMNAGSGIDIIVKNISSTSGVYLTGTNKSVITG